MKLVSWNVNGLRSIHKKGLFNFVKQANPEILCLQETKAHENDLSFDLKSLDSYQSFFSSAQRKGYSGVAVYTKKTPLKIDTSLGIEEFDKEGRLLKLTFKNLILFNIYFPNGKRNKDRLNYKMRFYEEFLKQAKQLLKAGKKVIVCGDVNTAHKAIDLARPKENEKISGFLPIERAWIDKFLKAGFVDSFRKFNQQPNQYSWWSMRTRARERNVGWRIDYFFVSKNLANKIKEARILSQVMGSDHCPIELVLKSLPSK